MKTKTSSLKPRPGAAVVEFAIVAPFMVMVTMGLVEVTRGTQVKHYLTDAARSGCRLAILPKTTYSEVQANVKTVMTGFNLGSAKYTLTVKVNTTTVTSLDTAKKGDKITVQISIPASEVNWVTPRFFTSSSITSEQLVMMKQS